MAAPQDVHVRICNQEIVKFDLEVKALIQCSSYSAKCSTQRNTILT
uniref:BCL2/adenovirus E1B interacting protein 1 n=1 Tax=Mus musculus TaxID=10090 RepID=F6WZQ6_MOUSE